MLEGIGLAHIKCEGAPIHPDDAGMSWGSDRYIRQLESYIKFMSDSGNGTPEYHASLNDTLVAAKVEGIGNGGRLN